MNFKEIEEKAVKFRDERLWKKYHTPKNLAISLVVEVGELLEHFQWETDKEIIEKVRDPSKKEKIADEIADIIIYLALLAHELNIDLDKAVERKLKKNEEKYPAKVIRVEEIVKELGGEIIEPKGEVKTVEQVVKLLSIDPENIIKSLVFIVNESEPILVIVDGKSKVSLEKLKKIFGNVRMAKPKEVEKITGYKIGEVPPVGVPIKTVVDRRVIEKEFVIGGGGRIDRLSKLNPKKIVEFQKAEVLDVSE
ncbi:YbaK/EbsC family protein [Thermococcus sibiricus]|uniref:Nucleotide pyrophosphohydrolase n=1 Tax=Thermococcus sibiricus TaxID=172049 RepID=A0A117L0W3_9EURY|nr:YbaK/EbsC family protein [Thermococcus sibiricus]KUK16656.1 MAG: Nucleotide pyrophosphohydrolase [Thermococcus sibiricus]